ncbi:hypothetical protein FQS87_16390 [Enterococcus avium]|uniref:hypothetical protein n=1 Tax=Enterococcus TaxID=1350 RepID=UPI001A96E3C2|nr:MULTISPECIES: hypothetical protein [Enterococcus]DAL82279.1 MAG TPA: DNA-directed RNA polymerase subunit [Caudoviricetes sp.]MBO1141489.1 hypothetical protein [Enterococcus avium]MDT2419468.1 hypothetical protein [Enterococcus avium]MDT2432454.1 hypothetical protein [Enterococcus avium]MDT2488739.1 hypothetical protein [Enterococcus avium]
MDIEKKTLKMKCESCGNDFILTFNTVKCPKCGIALNIDEIHEIFYNYESRLANSKLYQRSQRMQKSGERLEKTGETISQIGCLLFMLPIGLLCLWFLISMF